MYDADLIVLYNFDNIAAIGEDANTIIDQSSFSHDATPINASAYTAAGRYGGGYEFFERDDFICLDDAGTCSSDSRVIFDIAFTERSYGIWFKTNDTQATQVVWEIGGNYNGHNTYVAEGNVWIGSLYGVGPVNTFISYPINVNEWYHVSWDLATDNNLSLWVNGRMVNSTILTQSQSGAAADEAIGNSIGSSETHLGNLNGNPAWSLNGTVDDFMVWNRSLNEAEHYAMFAGNVRQDDTGHWVFEFNQTKDAENGLDVGNYTYNVTLTNGSSTTSETRWFEVTPDLSAVAPTIDTVTTATTYTPVEAGNSTVIINFTASDTNSNLDLTSGQLSVNFGTTTRVATCTNESDSLSTSSFTCSVDLMYYDHPGTWTLNLNVSDQGALMTTNTTETMTYDALYAFVINTNHLSFEGSAGTEIGATENPLIINNTGNANFSSVNITSYDLVGAGVIQAGNFSMNVTN